MKFLIPLVFAMIPLAVAADDRVPMQDDAHLENGLRVLAQGYFMRKNCAEVLLKAVKAYFFAASLKTRARKLGYSKDEIDEYFEDAGHKSRIETAARAELASLGLDFDDATTICPVAKAQVDAGRTFGLYFRIRYNPGT